jgi:preprotein translocase subunit YajC
MLGITNAWATTAATAPTNQGQGSIMLVFLSVFAVFYLLLLRPQYKRAKEHKQLVNNLSKGDEVITSGGLLGKVNKIVDDFVILQLAEGVEVKLQKSAITTLIPKGTLKAV